MPIFIALLRAVNVGGTGKLPMAKLKEMCLDAGFSNVQTYIASGNVIFETKMPEAKIKAALDERLAAYFGKSTNFVVRTSEEMVAILEANPFPEAAPNRTVVIFLDQSPPKNALEEISGQVSEELRLGAREIYVNYAEGIGDSKLKIPAAKSGTARNMNTVAKLVEIASSFES